MATRIQQRRLLGAGAFAGHTPLLLPSLQYSRHRLPAHFRTVSSIATTPKPASPNEQETADPPLAITWPHKGWDENLILNIKLTHRKPRTLGDHFAWRVTRICRYRTPSPTLIFTSTNPPQ